MSTAEHLMAGLPVSDFGAALEWYFRFTGRAPDVVPNETEAMWRLSGDGWAYIVLDADHAGRGTLTLMVSDFDGWVARLAASGIEMGAPETVPGLFRKTVITDPDGNRIQLGEDLSGG